MNILKTAVHAGITGFESPSAEFINSPLSLDDLLIEHKSATFFAQAEGHSMVGRGIFNGDVLVISRSVTAKADDVIVAALNGEFVAKIYDPVNRLLHSAAENENPYQLQDEDDFVVEGVVIRSIRMHRPLTQSLNAFFD
jgi:DNA polymerase V